MTTDDIVARLRAADGGYFMRQMFADAADEIERLRKELGQVSDVDAFVSEMDASHLDNLLNWCEFNEMEWHRALARLVADRARLRGELLPIRKELEQIRAERDEARQRTNFILTEIDCRIEHGAESNGHLEVLRDIFKESNDE